MPTTEEFLAGGGLGRRLEPADPRDRQFLAMTTDTEGDWLTKPMEELGNPANPGTRYWWDNGLWTDQGQTGTCVAHATLQWVEDSPVTHPEEQADPYDWYREIVLLDSWPENDGGDLNFGTSVHAAGRFLRNRGYISEYLWVRDIEIAMRWLLAKGPLLVGTSWLWSMFATKQETDATGKQRSFVQYDPSRGVAGGHGYLWNGVNIHAECIRVKLGSWGRDYGVEGRSNLHFAHASALIADWGEIMAAREMTGVPLEVDPLGED